jgi:hypothetical protein
VDGRDKPGHDVANEADCYSVGSGPL